MSSIPISSHRRADADLVKQGTIPGAGPERPRRPAERLDQRAVESNPQVL